MTERGGWGEKLTVLFCLVCTCIFIIKTSKHYSLSYLQLNKTTTTLRKFFMTNVIHCSKQFFAHFKQFEL